MKAYKARLFEPVSARRFEKAGIVDGITLKPDTWYKLENGEFVEVTEDD